MTQKHQNFREIYESLPDAKVKAPRKEFIERIAAVTMKSKKTIYCWLAGAQKPDTLSQSVIEKELGISSRTLFPEDYVKYKRTPSRGPKSKQGHEKY